MVLRTIRSCKTWLRFACIILEGKEGKEGKEERKVMVGRQRREKINGKEKRKKEKKIGRTEG